MATSLQPIPTATPRTTATPASPHWPRTHIAAILGLWLVIFAASLAGPPLLDDADATHAQAAQAMLATRDFVTLHVNGVRYLEKAPLPYWLAALSLRTFTSAGNLTSRAAFAIHLPLALTVLGLVLLGYAWSRRAFGDRAALYTAIFTLTAAGVFLFTRVFIPDALLSLMLAAALYSFLRALEPAHRAAAPHLASEIWAGTHARSANAQRLHAHLLWVYLALAILTKGFVALILFGGAALAFLAVTRELHRWRQLAPVTGPLLLIAIAAPWHLVAGLRNVGGAGGHGFFWFYFINEHVLRFLGQRIPRDYNKLPAIWYWTLHLVWLFPWSLFVPVAIMAARRESRYRAAVPFAQRTKLLLAIFAALVLGFFSRSTNQEYYTFPAYLPLLMLLAAAVAPLTADPATTRRVPYLDSETRAATNALTVTYAVFTLIGLIIAAALGYGLWTARHLAFVSDIGSVLAHRGVGDYTLSLSHLFDLTGPSFAALRLPAALAAMTFAGGPGIAWALQMRRRPHAAVLAVAATSAIFLIAAHLALLRFAPMLSSRDFVTDIQMLTDDRRIAPDTQVLLYGDQAFGSSIPFYLGHHVSLVDGRSTSMLFGSTFADVPPLFVSPEELAAQWGLGPRKLLFVPPDLTAAQRSTVDRLFTTRAVMLREASGKLLLTDRPLDITALTPQRPTP